MDLKHLHWTNNETTTFRIAGLRCRAAREIRGRQGLIKASTQGIILYQFENLSRTLIQVRWDNGMNLPVFPKEIEIID